MAGGSGERFWPVSTRERPKQFLRLGSPDQTLLEDAVQRAAAAVSIENTFIATNKILKQISEETCTELLPNHVWAEPHKRNTTGCLVWVAANLIAEGEGWETTTLAILTADQRIHPEIAFVRAVHTAMETAEKEDGIVTLGIVPDRPETGFGYIEVGKPVGHAFSVQRFREKPDLETAQEFLAEGGFLWNSGMFFYTLPVFMRELELHQPAIAKLTHEIAVALRSGREEEAETLFGSLPSISVDFAIMEKVEKVFVVQAPFDWDDLGSWDSLSRSFSPDEFGNVGLGEFQALDSKSSVIYCDQPGVSVHLLGIEGLVVVVTDGRVMICPVDRAQEVKRLLALG